MECAQIAIINIAKIMALSAAALNARPIPGVAYADPEAYTDFGLVVCCAIKEV
jgi:hypothetical protein